MFHGDRGGICIQHLPPKWRWQLPGRRSSPQISMLLYHLFIYDFLGFPMCFLCVSLFLYVFFPWFSFFSCCFFKFIPRFFRMFSPRLPGPVVETSLGVKELHLERWKAVLRSEGTQKNGICMGISCSLWDINGLQWNLNRDFVMLLGYEWGFHEDLMGF